MPRGHRLRLGGSPRDDRALSHDDVPLPGPYPQWRSGQRVDLGSDGRGSLPARRISRPHSDRNRPRRGRNVWRALGFHNSIASASRGRDGFHRRSRASFANSPMGWPAIRLCFHRCMSNSRGLARPPHAGQYIGGARRRTGPRRCAAPALHRCLLSLLSGTIRSSASGRMVRLPRDVTFHAILADQCGGRASGRQSVPSVWDVLRRHDFPRAARRRDLHYSVALRI